MQESSACVLDTDLLVYLVNSKKVAERPHTFDSVATKTEVTAEIIKKRKRNSTSERKDGDPCFIVHRPGAFPWQRVRHGTNFQAWQGAGGQALYPFS